MLQATKNKYTLETLLPLNVSYDCDYHLTESDVDMANALVELIEWTRTDEHPQVGDLMVHVSKHGDYSPPCPYRKRIRSTRTSVTVGSR